MFDAGAAEHTTLKVFISYSRRDEVRLGRTLPATIDTASQPERKPY